MSAPLMERCGRVVGRHNESHVIVRLSVVKDALCLVPLDAFQKKDGLEQGHDVNLIAVSNENGVQSVVLSDGSAAEAALVSSGTVWTTVPSASNEKNKGSNNNKEDKKDNKEEEGKMEEGDTTVTNATEAKQTTTKEFVKEKETEKEKEETSNEADESVSKGPESIGDVLDYEPLETLDEYHIDDENAAENDNKASSKDKKEEKGENAKVGGESGKTDIKARLGQRDPGSGNFLSQVYKSRFFINLYAGLDPAKILKNVEGKVVEVGFKKGIAKLQGQKDDIKLDGEYAVFWKSNSFYKHQVVYDNSAFETLFKPGEKIVMEVRETNEGRDSDDGVKYVAMAAWKGAKPSPAVLKSVEPPAKAKLKQVDPTNKSAGVAEMLSPLSLRGEFAAISSGSFVGSKGAYNKERELTAFLKLDKTIISMDVATTEPKTILGHTVKMEAQQCWLGGFRPPRQLKMRPITTKDVVSKTYSVSLMELHRPSRPNESVRKGTFVVDAGAGDMSNQLLAFDRTQLIVFGHRLDKTDLLRLLRPGEHFEVEISPNFDPKSKPPYPIKTAWIGPKYAKASEAVNTPAFKEWLKELNIAVKYFHNVIKGSLGPKPFFPHPTEPQKCKIVALFKEATSPQAAATLGVVQAADGTHAFFDRSRVYLYGIHLRKADLSVLLPIGTEMRCEIALTDMTNDQRSNWQRRRGRDLQLGYDVNKEAYLVYSFGTQRPSAEMVTSPLPKIEDISENVSLTKWLKHLSVPLDAFLNIIKGVSPSIPSSSQHESPGVVAPWTLRQQVRPQMGPIPPRQLLPGPTFAPQRPQIMPSTPALPLAAPASENPVIVKAKAMLSEVMQCTSPKDPRVGRIISTKSDHELAQFISKTLEKACQVFMGNQQGPMTQRETSGGPMSQTMGLSQNRDSHPSQFQPATPRYSEPTPPVYQGDLMPSERDSWPPRDQPRVQQDPRPRLPDFQRRSYESAPNAFESPAYETPTFSSSGYNEPSFESRKRVWGSSSFAEPEHPEAKRSSRVSAYERLGGW